MDKKEEIYTLRKEIDNLNRKIVELSREIEDSDVSKALEKIKTQKWVIEPHDLSLYLLKQDNNEYKEFYTFVCEELNLYSHGSLEITKNFMLYCSDGTISLRLDVPLEIENPEHNLNDEYKYDKLKATLVFSFVKELSLSVDFSRFDEEIEGFKKTLMEEIAHKKLILQIYNEMETKNGS